MTSNTPWISFNDVNKHPEDSALLAYLRGQKLEDRSSVIQHIENEKCSVCLRKLNEFKQVSATLDILGEMRSYQYYSELSVTDTYALMQNALNSQISAKSAMNDAYYRRPRKSAMRLISIPAAIGLTILFTMAMFVFASFSGRPFNPFSPTGDTKPGQNTLTMAVTPHTTSTPRVNVTATEFVTPGAKEPHIKVCSTQSDITQMRLVICGFNFDSRHKATLVVYVHGKRSFLIHAIPVDRHGKFRMGWPLATCSNVPTFIDGDENTGTKLIKVKLQIMSFGSCFVPTNTPVVKSSGFSPNVVP